jgi:NAD(P)-dependent dehydrogenase (short-subunit alcohol dehydrogenase family)
MMEPVLAPFTDLLKGVVLSAPAIPYISNVTGTWITPQQATSPAYYAEHLRRAVSFESGVRTLSADPATLLLEVGPGNVLTTLARLTLGKDGPKRVLQSIGRPQDERHDAMILREAAGKLWLSGVTLDFDGMQAGASPRRIPLPTYPFERKRYWVDPPEAAAHTAPMTAARSDRLDDWLFAPVWARDDVPLDEASRVTGVWLVLGDDGALSREVLDRVREAAATAILVERGARFERTNDTSYTVRAGSAEDLTAVADDLQQRIAARPAGAIHLWGVGQDALEGQDVYEALVGLGVGLGTESDVVSRVIHVSTNTESVLDETLHDAKSALAVGPVVVLPTEFPNVSMQSVDFDSTQVEVRTMSFAVVAAAGTQYPIQQSAWRHGRRWAKRYERIVLPGLDLARLPVKQQGVYLITGALGGIGLSLARWLATEFKARLLLTARSGLPPTAQWDAWLESHPAQERNAAAITAIRAIEAADGEVLVVAADASDEAAMAAAITAAHQRWGAIDGVIHAAGIAGSGKLAALKTPEDTRATLDPKVAGLDVLVHVLGKVPLDFMALMSSINSVLGVPGACDYAAANAVLDAFAAGGAWPSAWRHVVSFNWSAWRDVGMAANLNVPAARQAQWRAFLATAIPPAAGVEAFARGLASGRRRVIVASYDLLAQLQKLASVAPAAPEETGGAVPEATLSGSRSVARPELSTVYEPPQTDLEQQLAAIWSELLGVDRIGRHDDFFELGGHSLLATRVLARIQNSIGARLTLREVFDAPTVQKMASRLDRGTGTVTTADTAAEDREEIEF